MRVLLPLLLAVAAGCSSTLRAYPEQFAGVGLELHESQDGPHVLRPLPGSAAEHAGLQAGDRVVAVDGLPTAGRALADVVARLRGPPGSQVSVVLERGPVRLTVDLTRTAVARAGDDYRAASTAPGAIP
jgi:C-terminal processing protease CtpA/Prc